jgi:Mg2+/Co2+ transporter CorB
MSNEPNTENKESDKHSEREPDHEPEQESTLKRLISSVLNFKKPGTKEDLDHEIQELLEEGEEHGLISPLEEKMINSILEFRTTYASEIMTPAAEVVSFDEAAPLSELMDTVIESGFTRIPVYRDNPDRVIGSMHAKDLLKLCARPQAEPFNLESYLRPVYFISERKPIVDLLREFQKHKIHMAMVTDEFGTIRGLITLEDILEEIVGEFTTDPANMMHKDVHAEADGSFVVNASASVRALNRAMHWNLPTDGPKTLNGLIVEYLETIPEPGTSLKIKDYAVEVLQTGENAIKTVRISPLAQASAT